MKSLLLALALVAVLASPSPAELLSNRGFETGDFTGWLTFGQGWRIGAGADAQAGSYGAVNDVLGSDVDPWRGIYQNVPVVAGETYSASVYVRTLNLESSESWLEIAWKDVAGATVGAVRQSAHVAGDQLFAQVELPTLIAPAGAVTASVNGIVFMAAPPATDADFHVFDEFSFVQLPPNPVANRSFESGDLAGWSTFGQGWRIGAGGDALSGLYGLVNDVLDSDVDEFRGLFQVLPVATGTTYVASVQIRALNLESSESWLEIQWLDGVGALLGQAQSPHVVADQPFTLVELRTLEPPPDAVSISVRGIVQMHSPPGANADFHVFDDFSFLPQAEPDPVYLSIAPADGNHVVLSWDTPSSGYIPQATLDLIAPSWTNVPGIPTGVEGHWTLTLAKEASKSSYRLLKP